MCKGIFIVIVVINMYEESNSFLLDVTVMS